MRKRSDVLDLAILGRLASGPLHGYELRKQLSATLGMFRSLSFGSLYPRLRGLEGCGWITTAHTASLPHALASKRSRVSYELTAAGKEHLAETLTAADPAAWDDDVFDVRFSMFADTDPTTRLRILEGRRTRVLESREASRLAAARNRERRDAYTAELQRHGLEILDKEIGWLEGLIATERAAATPTTTTARPRPRRSRRHESFRPVHPPRRSTHEFHPRCHRGRRQLRELARAGRRVLQGRRPHHQGARPHARAVR
ncbi:PadR family transcriptional regulator [Serinibacter arcticus]|uniref:PadR family transcriptional regulator n=1 Tax=Serinibacter arcticus TaxID=1655435 RepID=UPI001F43E70F|nr:PadR family transcriptional regulator [Serinibacter arcticus]